VSERLVRDGAPCPSRVDWQAACAQVVSLGRVLSELRSAVPARRDAWLQARSAGTTGESSFGTTPAGILEVTTSRPSGSGRLAAPRANPGTALRPGRARRRPHRPHEHGLHSWPVSTAGCGPASRAPSSHELPESPPAQARRAAWPVRGWRTPHPHWNVRVSAFQRTTPPSDAFGQPRHLPGGRLVAEAPTAPGSGGLCGSSRRHERGAETVLRAPRLHDHASVRADRSAAAVAVRPTRKRRLRHSGQGWSSRARGSWPAGEAPASPSKRDRPAWRCGNSSPWPRRRASWQQCQRQDPGTSQAPRGDML